MILNNCKSDKPNSHEPKLRKQKDELRKQNTWKSISIICLHARHEADETTVMLENDKDCLY